MHIPKHKSRVAEDGGLVPKDETGQKGLPFAQEWLRNVATSPGNVILLEVEGDSMLSELHREIWH